MSSQEDLKYQKKYLKYKAKYLALEQELEQNGGGLFSSFTSAAKKGATYASSAAKTGASIAKKAAANPELKAAALTAATTVATVAAQDPNVQAKLAQAQQYYANSPNAQLAAQIAMSHPKVQSAMAHPVAQQAATIAKSATSSTPILPASSTSLASFCSPNSPDSKWFALSLEQKQKLIGMLQYIK
jgi:hypothetical protein